MAGTVNGVLNDEGGGVAVVVRPTHEMPPSSRKADARKVGYGG